MENVLQCGERGAERELQMPEESVPNMGKKACDGIYAAGSVIFSKKALELPEKI